MRLPTIHPGKTLLLALILVRCSPSLPDQVELAYHDLPEVIDFNFQVKPILADKCYACHGPDENSRQAGLRLDIEQGAFTRLASGKRALVKGEPAKSEVFHRILSHDPEYIMPPPDSKLSLTSREKAILVKWIQQGAEWKPHWSFIPVEKPAVPDPKDQWDYHNPIDLFVQELLHQQGLGPSSPADKQRLLRRVTMDLTGLPPTLAEVNDFLEDNSDNAYEKVVDRLLNSTAHAERLTMEWLDVARYSDTHGVSFDGFRNSWPWRDWVISAFRENMSYDQFITEQIAGDLLENATDQQKIATSFLRMGQLEGGFGSLPEEFRVEYVLERTALIGTSMLGLTVECARCHDHKFDPVSQKEFYQLSAFFNNTEEMGLGPLDGDRAPTLYLYDSLELQHLDSLDAVIETLTSQYEQSLEDIENIRTYVDGLPSIEHTGIHTYAFDQLSKYSKQSKDDKNVEVTIADGNKQAEVSDGVTLVDGHSGKAAFFDDEYDQISLKGSGLFETHQPFSAGAWIKTNRSKDGPTQTILGNSNNYAADYRGWDLFLDSTRHLHARLIHRLPDDYIEVMVPHPISANSWQHVAMTYDGSASAHGLKLFINGQQQETEITFDHLTRSILPLNDYTLHLDSLHLRIGRSYRYWTFDVGLFEGAIDEVTLADRQLSQVEIARLASQEIKFTAAQLEEHALLKNKKVQRSYAKLLEAKTSRKNIMDSVQQIMVMEEMDEPRPTYLLERGIYNQHGVQVHPGTPKSVMEFTEGFETNRKGLAAWITHSSNPLTSRVAVNRYWQLIFGKGLVRTAEDFGIQGERPSHPELLDWLAAEFMESGWDLRHLLKLMVMSNTYRQASYISDELLEKDPENIYYARSSSYRWPAEFIRDNVLASSGLLVREVGGPPIKTYQPEGLWTEPEFNSFLASNYQKDTLDALYRRSLYIFQRRFVPPPFMVTFDAASREYCEVRRKSTNSPLQALALLNEPQVVEATRILSERVLNTQGTLDDQIMLAYRLSSGIHPSDRQLTILKNHYQNSFDHFNQHESAADSLLSIGDMPWDRSLDKNQVAAMAMVASTIFNYDDLYMKR